MSGSFKTGDRVLCKTHSGREVSGTFIRYNIFSNTVSIIEFDHIEEIDLTKRYKQPPMDNKAQVPTCHMRHEPETPFKDDNPNTTFKKGDYHE